MTTPASDASELTAEIAWRRPPSVRRAYAAGRFGQLHYRIAGESASQRAPVLFIHASPTSGRHFEPVLAELGIDRVALAPDTPGFGDSDAPASPPEIDDYAAALGEFVLGLGLDRVDVVGYHTGSKIGCALALQRPGLVRRLAFVSTSIYTAAELEGQRRDFADPGVPRDGSHIAARWAFLNRWCKPDIPLIVRHKAVAEYLKSGPLAHWGHRAAFNYAHAEHLPKLPHPVLVFNFDDDLRLPTSRAAQYLRNGRLLDLPWAHGSIEVHAAEFARQLREHFDSPDRATSGGAPSAPVPTAGPARSTALHRQFFHHGGALVHLQETRPAVDDRPPLLLLHATPNSGRMFEALQPEIGRDRRTLAIDLPGHGESDAPATPPSIEDYAGIAAASIADLGLEKMDVLGIDAGAQVAIELALRHPALVRRVLLADAPEVPPEARPTAHAANPLLVLLPDGSQDVERYRALRAATPERVPDPVVARDFAESLRGGPMAWWGRRAAIDYDLRARKRLLREAAIELRAPAALDAAAVRRALDA